MQSVNTIVAGSFNLPVYLFTTSHGPLRQLGQFVDVNGDGLIDIVYSLWSHEEAINQVYLNNGAGWIPAEKAASPMVANSTSNKRNNNNRDYPEVMNLKEVAEYLRVS